MADVNRVDRAKGNKMKRNKLAIAVVGGVASLSLLGLGAGASFTDSAAASSHVTTGTINLGLSTDGVTFGKQVSWPDAGPLTSGSHMVPVHLYLHNYGNLPEHITSFDVATSGNLYVLYINIGNGDWSAGNHPVDITIPAGGDLMRQVNLGVWSNDQGAVGDLVLTANGTDIPTP